MGLVSGCALPGDRISSFSSFVCMCACARVCGRSWAHRLEASSSVNPRAVRALTHRKPDCTLTYMIR